MSADPRVAEVLNATCSCITVDHGRLDEALRAEAAGLGLGQLVASHPHLFSESAVFVDRPTADAMQEVVAAVERVVALPSYREHALRDAHPHARTETRARGAFLGFDFHVSADGPKLIEINTNAGGGLLNAVLRKAQRACCEPVAQAFGLESEAAHDFFAMMQTEWQLARGDTPVGRIAIVDDAPTSQFLYPEFVLFRELCRARGVAATICDPRELELRDGALFLGSDRIDFVYNRLTDFALEQPEHGALATAFVNDLCLITPHPRAYALYADKRRLAVLSDREAMRALGVADSDAELLSAYVPRTIVVTPALRDELWTRRKQLFFKPQTGYGAKAAYRGESISKRVFEQVLSQPYVAQELVPPSSRTLLVREQRRELKLDIRNFAYAGHVQLVCARLYQGQTTNFRSEGGGFAPVYSTG